MVHPRPPTSRVARRGSGTALAKYQVLRRLIPEEKYNQLLVPADKILKTVKHPINTLDLASSYEACPDAGACSDLCTRGCAAAL